MIRITADSPYPAFIKRAGQILTRKLYEYRIIDDKLVAIDLPEPGKQPEYLSQDQVRLWQEQNKRTLDEYGRKFNR